MKDLELLVDSLMAVLGVLYKGKFTPSDETMDYVSRLADEIGYEPPRGWR